jgi:hypothetical protein
MATDMGIQGERQIKLFRALLGSAIAPIVSATQQARNIASTHVKLTWSLEEDPKPSIRFHDQRRFDAIKKQCLRREGHSHDVKEVLTYSSSSSLSSLGRATSSSSSFFLFLVDMVLSWRKSTKVGGSK